ncbi:TetR/AcrR family transcriptional regulator [Streptomyces litchfieldiae]|uniref:TetR/AcrR family transcriptional regulator n=1 Tax=Streptomyces litchfieldiae TaxID=3075543 RepID=A0ABU2MW48_9ACTN|nr:TetR/AcrR family transcriptional regulator [Streptomyces sp. DSM 44938]MDT0345314.1 TetR/AcrR family transcriptional regulator [Streptomyces sp. DSM 44938]
MTAAADILEEHGYQGVTIEGIARRSGAAKTTIYRWWDSKAELVMDAYTHTVAQRMPEPDTGSVRDDLVAYTAELYDVVNHPLRVRALRGLMAEAQLDPGFERPFRAWVATRRQVVAAILGRGRDRGELRPDLDLEHAVDLLFGPYWYRLLVGHLPLDPREAERHIDQILNGLRAPLGQLAPETDAG